MPETPEELYARTKDALRMPPVEEWEQWPFEGALRPRELRPPEERERPRFGEGGVDCGRCAAPDSEYIWTNETWRLWPFTPPNGLPLVVLLEPREHYAEPGDLPDELAADLGVLVCRIERESAHSATSAASTSAGGATAASTCTGGSWPARRGSRS